MHTKGSVSSVGASFSVEEVRDQLDRIVSSKEFPGTGRSASFLRYVVEEAIMGRTARIKGYTVAIEVFGRSDNFTQDDPVVRIEAGRLRRSLERYYLVEGQSDPVIIGIPKGGYAPSFSRNGEVCCQTNGAVPTLKTLAKTERKWWDGKRIGSAAILLCLVGLVFWITASFIPRLHSSSQSISAPDRPTIVVAPFANVGDGSDAGLYAVGLTEELLTALPRFREIRVFGRETSKAFSSDVDASTVREQLGARYLLAGGVRTSGNRLRVTARLLDTASGEIVWSRDYDNDLGARDLFSIQKDVARRVATAIAQPYGVMAQIDAASPPPSDPGVYGCTFSFYAYRAELSTELHSDVRECLETAVVRYPNYSTAWAMLSIVYLDEDRFRFNQRPDKEPPMQRALQAARRATQLDAADTRGLQALMMALFFNRELAEATRVGEHALAINPNDTELMGEFGTRLAMGGQWRRGAAMLEEAIALNPGGGGYYHGTRALAAYMLEDNTTAVREIAKADMQKFPLFHAVAAVIYAEAGMMDAARREGAVFMQMRPDFLANIESELAMRNLLSSDQARLIAGLRKAGLTIPPSHRDAQPIAVSASDPPL